jgi:hypothetical protein
MGIPHELTGLKLSQGLLDYKLVLWVNPKKSSLLQTGWSLAATIILQVGARKFELWMLIFTLTLSKRVEVD